MKLLFGLIWLLVSSVVGAASPICDRYPDEHKLVDTLYDKMKEVARYPNYPGWAPAYPELDALLTRPVGSSCWLVRELHETHNLHLLMTQAKLSHQIWAIRALRYITNCKDFYGEIPEAAAIDPTSDRWYFLLRKGRTQVPFFATWMSRDSVRIAPSSVQRKVIEQWQAWYESDASTFQFSACEKVDDWYF